MLGRDFDICVKNQQKVIQKSPFVVEIQCNYSTTKEDLISRIICIYCYICIYLESLETRVLDQQNKKYSTQNLLVLLKETSDTFSDLQQFLLFYVVFFFKYYMVIYQLAVKKKRVHNIYIFNLAFLLNVNQFQFADLGQKFGHHWFKLREKRK